MTRRPRGHAHARRAQRLSVRNGLKGDMINQMLAQQTEQLFSTCNYAGAPPRPF